MTPTPHKTPLNPKPPARTKSRVGHSKLSASRNGAQRRPLANSPSICAGRTTPLSAAWAETSFTKATVSNHPPLGGQLHLSAAQPPPANIQIKLRKAPPAVPDSYSVGSSLPPGTPAVPRPESTVGTAEILIENARLEFRVNDRKQTFAIKSNRERMALSFHENPHKRAGKMPAHKGKSDAAAAGKKIAGRCGVDVAHRTAMGGSASRLIRRQLRWGLRRTGRTSPRCCYRKHG